MFFEDMTREIDKIWFEDRDPQVYWEQGSVSVEAGSLLLSRRFSRTRI